MKKLKLVVVILLALTLSISAFVACGGGGGGKTDVPEVPGDKPKEEVKNFDVMNFLQEVGLDEIPQNKIMSSKANTYTGLTGDEVSEYLDAFNGWRNLYEGNGVIIFIKEQILAIMTYKDNTLTVAEIKLKKEYAQELDQDPPVTYTYEITQPTKTDYLPEEPLDLAGFKLVKIGSDNSNVELQRGADYSIDVTPFDAATTGEVYLPVTLVGSSDFQGNVIVRKLEPQIRDFEGAQTQKVVVTYNGTAVELNFSLPTNADSVSASYRYKEVGEEFGEWSTTKPSFTDPGAYEIEVKLEKDGYNEQTLRCEVTIRAANFDNAEQLRDLYGGFIGDYDGQPHGLTINAEVSVPVGATVKYSAEESADYPLSEAPTYTNAGSYRVYYEVSKHGYTSVYGNAYISIYHLPLEGITADNYVGEVGATSGSITLNGVASGDTVEYRVGDGGWNTTAISVTTMGATEVHYRVTRENYRKEGSAYVYLTPNATLTGITPYNYTYEYNGEERTAGLDGTREGDLVYYRLLETDEWETTRLGGTNAGVYNVLYKVVRPGVGIATGTATVTIEKGEYTENAIIDELAKVGIDRYTFTDVDYRKYGTLADIVLPEGASTVFSWVTPTTAVTTTQTYVDYLFNADSDNYEDYEGSIPVMGKAYYDVTFVQPAGCVVTLSGRYANADITKPIRVYYGINFTVTLVTGYEGKTIFVGYKNNAAESVLPVQNDGEGEYNLQVSGADKIVEIYLCYQLTYPSQYSIANFSYEQGGYSWQCNSIDAIFDTNTVVYVAPGTTVPFSANINRGYVLTVEYSNDGGITWTKIVREHESASLYTDKLVNVDIPVTANTEMRVTLEPIT